MKEIQERQQNMKDKDLALQIAKKVKRMKI